MAGKVSRRGTLTDVQRAAYILGGFGSLVIIVAYFLHSKTIFVVGIVLIVLAVLLSVPIFRADATKETRLVATASSIWAVLFVGWLVVATLVPAVRHAAATPVSVIFVIGFFALAHGWWRIEHKPRKASRKGKRGSARTAGRQRGDR